MVLIDKSGLKMESCNGVERELNNVQEKLNKFANTEGEHMANIIREVKAAKEELENGNKIHLVSKIMSLNFQNFIDLVSPDGHINPAQTLMLMRTLHNVKETVQKVSGAHRDLHSSVSKVGKAIDRNFVTDYDSTSREDVFASQEQQRRLNEVILQHFYRQGQLELSDILADEAKIKQDVRLSKEPFQELNAILEALSQRNLAPALDWAARNRTELQLRGTPSVFTRNDNMGHEVEVLRSSLEMKLHKLQFIELLRKGNQMEAISYARNYFPNFVGHHEKEIQHLMGAVMFAGDKLSTSPYHHLLDNTLWHEISDLFVKDACALMGLSIESPLSVVINAGCTALPALLNIKQVMQQRQVAGVWNAKDELPIEIDLGPDCRYHSIFACPILRQQTTELNPPLRLTCGHCISRDALNKLSSGHKLKCPYCPVEQNPNDARQITF